MAYHVSEVGRFGTDRRDPTLPGYYLAKGDFVPEPGDRAEDFTSPSGQPYDPQFVGPDGVTWADWVAAAAAATQRATQLIREDNEINRR